MVTIDAEIVLFDGFDELDAIGPYEVLANGAAKGGSIETRLVTLEPTDVVRASHGLRVEPDDVLGQPDLLVVPGGGWSNGDGGVRRAFEEGQLAEVIADTFDGGATVASVCTGAMLLAQAGLLEGRPAITHHSAVEDLAEYADVVDARVVDDGDVLTAGGVTSGIDLALWLLEREFDADVADAVSRLMEHERRGDVHR